MPFPSILEYKQAVIAAGDNFKDLLPLEMVEETPGQPKFASGNFAVVFKMRNPETDKLYAVKCFHRDSPDRHERLTAIAGYLQNNSSPYWVHYRYLPNELWVDSEIAGAGEYPVVFMEWAEGVTLFEAVRTHCTDNNTGALQQLSEKFSSLAVWLLSQPIAHGDLKHDNILVTPQGELVLIDYDGMYLEVLNKFGPCELGGTDYQHPLRGNQHYDLHIDDFSIAVINVSLQGLAIQPALFEKYNIGNNLILTRSDLQTPTSSPLIQTLKTLDHPTINALLQKLQESIQTKTLRLPGLTDILQPPVTKLILPPTIDETVKLIALKRQELARLKTHLMDLQTRPVDEKDTIVINTIPGNIFVKQSGILLPTHMKLIKGGTFDMGDVFDDNHYEKEKPVHQVTLSDFYMSAYCVTFEEYDAFCEAKRREKPDDKGWGRGNRPVINVEWYFAVEYCNWLSRQHKLTPAYDIKGNVNNLASSTIIPIWNANGYRLPTEAEWEYAAREGGKKVRFGNGQNILRATEANFDASASYKKLYSEVGEYRGKTVPVDSFKPNALGLYNMSGNVWEWCWDWMDSDYYKKSHTLNPKGPDSGSRRVRRGGSWGYDPQCCRVAYRFNSPPGHRFYSLGFRLVASRSSNG